MERFTDTHIIIYRIKQQIGTHKFVIFFQFICSVNTNSKKEIFISNFIEHNNMYLRIFVWFLLQILIIMIEKVGAGGMQNRNSHDL